MEEPLHEFTMCTEASICIERERERGGLVGFVCVYFLTLYGSVCDLLIYYCLYIQSQKPHNKTLQSLYQRVLAESAALRKTNKDEPSIEP